MPPFVAKLLLRLVVLVAVFALGGGAVLWLQNRARPSLPDGPTIIVKMREVARLETLDVTLYKKVSFAPDPEPAASVWGDVFNFVKHTINAPAGRAIVFADVHLGLDLSKLGEDSVRVRGDKVEVVLPPVQVKVELRPGDTEVIGSNLDSAQTAKLFELAKDGFEREAKADPHLTEKARQSAERSLRALLLTLGFREVTFVAQLPGPS